MPAIKVYTANLGFYEVAVAARSQKMALAHWGVKRDLFREGIAKESRDPQAIESALQKVGLVYRRPLGSGGAFEEKEEARKALIESLSRRKQPPKQKQKPKPKSRKPTKAPPASWRGKTKR